MEKWMQKAKFGLLMILMFFLAACNAVPPTVVVQVVTPTTDPRVISITVTPDAASTVAVTIPAPTPVNSSGPVTSGGTFPATVDAAQTGTPSAVVLSTTQPAPSGPTATFVPTQTLSAFPTEVRAPLYVAQQDFEKGYMFWVSSQKVIWVLYKDTPDGKTGEWRAYTDTFLDGEPEFDPNLTPPSADRYQPKRGFGKLWRNTADIKDKLGWGTTPEFGLTTTYVYQHGGTLNPQGTYVPAPGAHFLTSLSRQTFKLSEPDPAVPGSVGRWELLN